MVRVLQDVSHMHRAGIETILMRYYKYIDKSKIQFDFLINKNIPSDYDEEIKAMGGNLYYTPGLNPLKMRQYKKYVQQVLQDNPDIKILHAHNDAMEYPALLAAKEINFPVRIAHSHNTSVDFNLKWPIKALYKYLIPPVATHYFGCGVDAVRYFFGEGTVKSGDYCILKNAIEPEKFVFNQETRDKIRNQLGISDNTYLIGHVGRFTPQKNHEFIIDIASKIVELINSHNSKAPENFDFKIILIGDGEEKIKAPLRNRIKSLGLENKFIFTGSIPNVNEYYQAMDMFILPSKYEGLPLVGIEAQTADLPCLFSDKITRELQITRNVDFIELKAENWAYKIFEKARENKQRTDMTQQIIDAGYDIKTQAKELERLYLAFAGERWD